MPGSVPEVLHWIAVNAGKYCWVTPPRRSAYDVALVVDDGHPMLRNSAQNGIQHGVRRATGEPRVDRGCRTAYSGSLGFSPPGSDP